MLSTAFGPQGPNYALTRSATNPNVSGAQDTWVKDCSAAGANDGTYLTASFFNNLLGNLRYLARVGSITLTDGDDTMIALAVQSGQTTFGLSTGTNAYTINLTPQPQALTMGMEILVFIPSGNANTSGATTLTVTGLGLTKPIVKQNGNAPVAGDLVGFVPLAWDGTSWRVNGPLASDISTVITNNFIITTGVLAQVGGAAPAPSISGYPNYFATLAAAFTWVSNYVITATGSVTFQFPAGQTMAGSGGYVSINHPNGNRIFLTGAAPIGAGIPNNSSFAGTGNGSAARTTDRATNLAAMRTRYGSELLWTNGAGLLINGNGLGSITNLLFTGDGSNLQDLITIQSGQLNMTGVTLGGAGARGVIMTQNGSGVFSNCHVFGAGTNGFSVEEGGRLIGSLGLSAHGCGVNGINANLAGFISMDQSAGAGSIYSLYSGGTDLAASGNSSIICGPAAIIRNGVNGVVASGGSNIYADGAVSDGHFNGFQATGKSFISALNTPLAGSNSQYGYIAQNGSTIVMTGGSAYGATATASPAVNVIGNNNSINIQ